MQLGVTIKRNLPTASYSFTDVFQGFEKVEAVRSIFGERTEGVLAGLSIVLSPREGYLHIDGSNGSIIVSSPYLKSADERYIYLDLIHELVHVKQFMEGMELWDRRYSYVDRPTEIEAHTLVVQEARRIGLKEEELVDYLRVEWISDEEFESLLRTLHVGHKIKAS
jgi:hypothetical protein